ncbi:1,4-alpha-glucan branching protein GlgB [Teredinibacter waterburyi]|uniref:1,4-alpha-glucan branching protein GlgB n=1 Tax=Teredinibacter waterburyi TaxID=1500538 RepID=UPI00165F4C39|nr:1,4-alpha-glucan branching protein GlgB [Teredinibacter waterburyi]
MDTLSHDVIQSIVDSDCEDIFAYLGCHQVSPGYYAFRAFLPNADSVEVLDQKAEKTLLVLTKLHTTGFFSNVARLDVIPHYKLRVCYGEHCEILEDPYRFGSSIGEQDLYLFGEGTHESAYSFMGAHLCDRDGVAGCSFVVWAPNARRVSVVGDFNFWDGRRHMMRKHVPSGLWEIFIPGVAENAQYKYELRAGDGSLLPHKADPYGFFAQVPPEQASCVFNNDRYQWGDQEWGGQRHLYTKRDRPISIYEVHLGSWRRVPEENNRYLTYRELAAQLIPYVKDMGFTHLQLMPVSEFPFDGSWGYQPIGMFAPTSRFGSPDDFKYFVDQCHQAGVAVLIDWVPGHFPTDQHGLGRFDGTPLYEHADSRQGFHPDWNTFIYNYGRKEVSNYLMANALYWLDVFHIDGLRVDAVASMLYLDYSRKEGEWLPNAYGGRENLEAIDFLRNVNTRVYQHFPDAMMVAEESTAWPGVSQPTHFGGLGFGFKWNMGWMNDSLEYIAKESIHRQYHHHDMTFSLYYAFSENFVLPLSHDEVVHGKRSILGRMQGDAWQQFANLRTYYSFMWAHPGKKLVFMGCEIAQGAEWDHNSSIAWHQLELPEHRGVQQLIRDLNHLYISEPALHEVDCDGLGFEWIEADDYHNSVFAFNRKSRNKEETVVVVSNFTPVYREHFRVGVNESGYYKELLNTDAEIYGGSNKGNAGGVQTEATAWHHREQSIVINLPPLSTVVLKLQR